MLANTPVELRNEMINRIKSTQKNQDEKMDKSDGGKALEIFRKAEKIDGSIERTDVYSYGLEDGYDESEINTILSQAETEGILVRTGKDVWKLI